MQIDPWKILKEVHWPPARSPTYIIMSANFWRASHSSANSTIFDAGVVLPDPPVDYGQAWTTQITVDVAVGKVMYADAALYDETGSFIANSSEPAAVKPTMPQTSTFGVFEISSQPGFLLKAALGAGDADPLFAGYKTIGSDPIGYVGGFTFGTSGLFHIGIGGTLAQEWRQSIGLPSGQENVAQVFSLLPTSVSYRGEIFVPIGARQSGPFAESGSFTDVRLHVLCKK